MATAMISQAKIKASISAILKGADLSQLSSKKVRKQLEEKFQTDLTERKEEIDELLMDMIEAGEKSPKKVKNATIHSADDSNGKKDSNSDGSDSEFEEPEDAEPATKTAKLTDEDLAKQLHNEENGRKTRHKKPAPTPKKKPRKKAAEGSGEKRASGYGKPCILSPALAEIMGSDKMARSDVVSRMWAIIKERNLKDPKNGQFMLCDAELLKVFGRKRVRTFGMMKYLTNHMTYEDSELV